MKQGTLPSGMKWLEQDGELFVYGANTAGEQGWLTPAWDTLSGEDKDEMFVLMEALTSETDRAISEIRALTSGEWSGFPYVEIVTERLVRAITRTRLACDPEDGTIWGKSATYEIAPDGTWERCQRDADAWEADWNYIAEWRAEILSSCAKKREEEGQWNGQD